MIIRDCGGSGLGGLGDEGRLEGYFLLGLSASPSCVCAEENESEKKLGEFRGGERNKEKRTEHSVTQIGGVWGSPNPSFTT